MILFRRLSSYLSPKNRIYSLNKELARAFNLANLITFNGKQEINSNEGILINFPNRFPHTNEDGPGPAARWFLNKFIPLFAIITFIVIKFFFLPRNENYYFIIFSVLNIFYNIFIFMQINYNPNLIVFLSLFWTNIVNTFIIIKD